MTADEGEDPLLTVWDSFSGYVYTCYTHHFPFFYTPFSHSHSVPVCTLFEGLRSGCVGVALSHDAHHLATLSSLESSQVRPRHTKYGSHKPRLQDHFFLKKGAPPSVKTRARVRLDHRLGLGVHALGLVFTLRGTGFLKKMVRGNRFLGKLIFV